MINVPKFVYYAVCICILFVVATFCVLAIVNNDTTSLINNVILAITSAIALVIKKDDTSDGNGTGSEKVESKFDTTDDVKSNENSDK